MVDAIMPEQHKVLSKDMAKNLLRQSANRQDEPKHWPGEENMIRLANAVKSDSPYVVFRNGVRFDLKYNDDNVRVKPSTGGFVPMGYFSFKTLRDAEAVKNAIDS
jgi:hypothetical protein